MHDESTTRGGTPSGLYKLADHYEIIMREAAESSISAYDLMGEIHAKIRENEEKLKTTPLKNKESSFPSRYIPLSSGALGADRRNIADAAISVSVIGLVLYYWKKK